jgi:hypothetical protein
LIRVGVLDKRRKVNVEVGVRVECSAESLEYGPIGPVTT